MQIILIQAEIEVAIRNYVNSKVKIAADQDIRIDLSASRGPEGFRANIDIVDAEVPVEAYSPRAATTAAPKTAAVEADEPAPTPTPKKKAAPAQLEVEVEEPAATPTTPSTEEVAADEPSAQEQEVAQEQKQEVTNVEETTEASTTEPAPAVRKPLFGKSLASLNA